MFTGIVERMGTIGSVEHAGGRRRLVVEAPEIVGDMNIGDSVAVNGVCLTAVGVASGGFEVEAVIETLERSNLGELKPGDHVNLERPLAAGGRLDGHIVQGHVDGMGTLRSIETEGASRRLWFEAPPELRRYLVEKGSVSVDGVSLTVSGVDPTGFEVVLIPHTLDVTVFGTRRVGDRVNLEVDVLAKYVERLLEERS
jgi:riboflavin synthase